jgi:hypothetical protein
MTLLASAFTPFLPPFVLAPGVIGKCHQNF